MFTFISIAMLCAFHNISALNETWRNWHEGAWLWRELWGKVFFYAFKASSPMLASTKPPALAWNYVTMLTKICFPHMQVVNSLLFPSNTRYETLQTDLIDTDKSSYRQWFISRCPEVIHRVQTTALQYSLCWYSIPPPAHTLAVTLALFLIIYNAIWQFFDLIVPQGAVCIW